ncbi:MAG: ABC transporter permease [Armatimonadota bacterium]
MSDFQLDIPLIEPGWVERRLPRLAGLAAVTHKEMRAQQRQMRVWWRLLLRIVFILACFGWLLYSFMTMAGVETRDYFRVARFDGIWSFFIQVLALAQVLPDVAGAIARERETGALEMLLLTRLRSSEILGGKLLAACLPVVIIFTVTVCAGLIMLKFAGTEAWMMLHTALRLFLLIFSAAGIGLLCSAWFGRSGQALGATVGVLAARYLLSSIFSMFFFLLRSLGSWETGLYGVQGTVFTCAVFGAGAAVLAGKGIARLSGKAPSMPFRVFLGILFFAGFLAVIYAIFSAFQSIDLVDTDYRNIQWMMTLAFLRTVPLSLLEILVLFWLAVQRLEALRRR